MNSYKFRGRNIKTKEWVYGDLMYHKRFIDENPYIKESRTHQIEWIDVDPLTVGMFTGLTDKNGNEIYEGDVIRFDTWRRTGVIETVIIEGGACSPFFDSSYCDDEQGEWIKNETIEVTGTIHD